jgi:GxxExxY protein
MNQVRDPRTYAINGAAMEVHRQLGCGFLEAVYQEALAVEFSLRGIPFKREVEIPISYKDRRLTTTYRADFVCYDGVITELKALTQMGGVEEAQILNYLRATGYEVGLLLNFGAQSLEYKRFILSKSAKSAQSAD